MHLKCRVKGLSLGVLEIDSKNIADRLRIESIGFVLLCMYVLLSCLEDFGANHFLRAAFIMSVISFAVRAPKIEFRTKHPLFLAFFLLTLLITVFYNGGISQSYDGIRIIRSDYLLPLLPMLTVLYFVREKRQMQIIFLCLAVSLCIAGFFGIYEYLVYGAKRVGGASGGIMPLAGILILLFPTMILLYKDNQFFPYCKKFLFVTMIVVVITIFFNNTRIVWIALVITVPIALFMHAGRIKLRLVLYLIVAGVLLWSAGYNLPSTKERLDVMFDPSLQSNSERILMWHSAWNMFKDHPFAGVGLGNYKEQYLSKYISPLAKESQMHAHSNIMHLAASTGILGAGAYIAMFGYFLYESFQNWRRTRNTAPILFFCATLGFLIHGLTDYNIGFIGVAAKIYWMILGIYLVMDQLIIVENR